MLEEILNTVRSIDKATNRSSLTDLHSIFSSAEITGVSPSAASVGEILKHALINEVQKTDSVLAQALFAGTAYFDDGTLTIILRHLVPEQRLQIAKEAATRFGQKVAFYFPSIAPPAS